MLQHDGHEINRLIEGVIRGYTYPNDLVALLGLIVIGVILPYGCVEECHTLKLINLKHSCLHIYDVPIMSGSILMSLKFFVMTIYWVCLVDLYQINACLKCFF